MRRRIGQLERLMQCKTFVDQMDHFTRQLHSRAEELCDGIRLKQVALPLSLRASLDRSWLASVHSQPSIEAPDRAA